MVKSMTGYGRAEQIVGNKKITIEIKSLNSKGLDCNVKIPSLYRSKDATIRTLLSKEVRRGKCDLYLSYDLIEGEQNHTFNRPVLKNYYNDLAEFATEMGLSNDEGKSLLPIIARMPDALISSKEQATDDELEQIHSIIEKALVSFQEFRSEEGNSLELDLKERIQNIHQLLDEVLPLESERIETVRERIKKNLTDLVDTTKIDQNRFEQELIYYIEKYDISEEKIRLRTHLNYFSETMGKPEEKGKKLGFISQEIGREINTLGSKANHAVMQKIVVEMKDELECIKEQVLNVL